MRPCLELFNGQVVWCILEDHVFQRLNVTDGCLVSRDFISGFTSLAEPDILNKIPETKVHAPPSLGVYEPLLLQKLGLTNFDDCSLTMWRGPVRHQLKGGDLHSHHHEVWRLVLIHNHSTGEGFLWPVGRDTDIQDHGTLDMFMVRSTEVGANVVWLDISDTQLEELPREICQLKHLRKLECHSNCLVEIPSWLCRGPEGEGPPPLEYAAFNSNRIERVTPLLAELSSLRWLSLNGNRLTRVPELPGGVERLSLHCNSIAELPPRLGCEASVRAVSLHGNRIREIPETFLAGLKSCNTLSLMRNEIERVPESVGEMAALQDLWLYGNRIAALPEALRRLTRLKRLWLDSNAIRALPEGLGGCEALEELYASHNALRTVPEALASCRRLRVLHLEGNDPGLPQRLPPELRAKLPLEGGHHEAEGPATPPPGQSRGGPSAPKGGPRYAAPEIAPRPPAEPATGAVVLEDDFSVVAAEAPVPEQREARPRPARAGLLALLRRISRRGGDPR